MTVKSLLTLGLLCLALVFSQDLKAQGQDKTVLFSARVLSSRTGEFLPLAYAYNPQAGRGALADNFGLIEMYVFPGDSIVFSYVGFKKTAYIIPNDKEMRHQALVKMDEESTFLAEVKVFRHSSEEEFKKAFLEMRLSDEKQRQNANNNLEQSKLNTYALQAGMGAAANFRNFSDQMISSQANRTFFATPMMALTNPFAWANFLKSIRNGDLKRKDYQKAFELPPRENISRQMYLNRLKSN